MPFNTIRKLLWRTSIAVALSTVILILASPQRALAGVRGLLVGDQYFSNLSPSLVATTKTSGYNTLILFLVNVNTNGDLVGPNNEPLVSNGVYNGNSSWGAQLASLKAAPSCINRIEMFTGGASGRSFPDIQSLVNSQGTGSGSILYRNFQALYNATHVDAICFDDESTYDLSTSVPFGRMLAALGMRVTLCPYTNQSYWASLLSQLGPYNAGSGSVDGVYLQCYDGGAGNDPGNWKSALGGYDKVYPGLWTNSESVNVNSISTVTSKMRNWQSSDGIIGGWIDANGTSPAVNDPWAQDVAYGIDQPYFNIINKYSNNSMDLIGANGAAGADINLWATQAASISAGRLYPPRTATTSSSYPGIRDTAPASPETRPGMAPNWWTRPTPAMTPASSSTWWMRATAGSISETSTAVWFWTITSTGQATTTRSISGPTIRRMDQAPIWTTNFGDSPRR